MKTFFRFFVLFLYLALGSFLQASDIAQPDAAAPPQINVKKKSNFQGNRSGLPYSLDKAFNTDTGDTLVVWNNDAGPPYTPEGRILSAAGKSTTKKLPAIAPDTVFGSAVSYNPVTKEFLLVYTRIRTETLHDIVGLRLDSNAHAIGKEFQIIAGAEDEQNHYPHVIFNPETNAYTLVWQSTLRGLMAALLDESGNLNGSIKVLERPEFGGLEEYHVGRIILDLAVLPSGNKLLILFRHRFNVEPRGHYWLATLDPQLKKVKGTNFAKINKTPLEEYLDPNATHPQKKWGGSLAVMQDGSALVCYADNTGVKGRKIDEKGKLSGKAAAAFSGELSKRNDLFDPKVAFSTTPKGTVGLLIATQNETGILGDPATAWAQVLNSKGRPTGDPVTVLNTGKNYFNQGGSLLIALPRNPSETISDFVWLQTLIYNSEFEPLKGSIEKLTLEVTP